MGQEIASDDDLGPGSCSKIAPATHPSASNLNAGTYFVWIQKFNDDATVPLYQSTSRWSEAPEVVGARRSIHRPKAGG